MYNHFAVILGNLGFLGTGECEKMRCGTNTQEVVKMCREDVFEKAKTQVGQLSSRLFLTASGRDIWESNSELLKHMRNHQELSIWSCQYLNLVKNHVLIEDHEEPNVFPSGWVHFRS